MKIAIATAVYFPMINGVAVFSHNLAVGLAQRGHEVMVLCPSQTGKAHTEMIDGVKTVYLRSIDAKIYPDQVHDVPKKRQLFYKHGFRVSPFAGGEIKRALDEFQPDVVHVQVSDPIGLSVVSYARKYGIPVVTTEHNQPEVLTEPLHVPGMVRRPINKILNAYFVRRQNKSDFVTMPTKQAIMNLLDGRGFKVPVAAVSNGVDLSHFKPGKATSALYRKYGVPEGAPVVLYVGRMDPEKKVGVVVEAFAKFLKDNKVDRLSKTCLVVVGDGVDKKRLEKLCKERGLDGNVKFLGRIVPPDLYEIYKMGDVFATASEIETQGIVLIEAAASGLPLIAVDAGAVGEVCINGKNGVLCRPGDTSGIAEAMGKILLDEDLRRKFSEASVKIAHEHDFEKTLDQFINIYNKVIRDKNS
ncbi:glycosyltransferase [Candidatus Saccharibacteria bacterium]|nr:glycosyltransferase [Candidatus Saccharibacteria bacterium]